MIPASADIHPSNLGYEIMGNEIFKDINKDMGNEKNTNDIFDFIYRSQREITVAFYEA